MSQTCRSKLILELNPSEALVLYNCVFDSIMELKQFYPEGSVMDSNIRCRENLKERIARLLTIAP